MKLEINKVINEKNIKIEESIDFSKEDALFKLTEPAKAQLCFEHVGNGEIHVRGAIEAKILLTCVICLNEFPMDMIIKIDETYAPEKESTPKNKEFTLSDLNEYTYKENYLDTAEIVKDNILESIPSYPKCPECSKNS